MNKITGFVSLKILNKTGFNQVTYGFKFSKHVYCVLRFFSSCFLIPCVSLLQQTCIGVYEGGRDFIVSAVNPVGEQEHLIICSSFFWGGVSKSIIILIPSHLHEDFGLYSSSSVVDRCWLYTVHVLYHDIKYVLYFLSDVRNFQRVIWTLAEILVLH